MPTNTTDRFNNTRRYRDGDHENQRQLTPSYVLDPVRTALGGIGLDPCTEVDNPTAADIFYTVGDDGLSEPWWSFEWQPPVYVNPPYSRAREPWVQRCVDAGMLGQKVVLLIPAHTDTRVFQRALETASAVVFIRGRVKFGVLRANRRQEAASHPSALLGWNVDLTPCGVLGRLVTLRQEPDKSSSVDGACRRHPYGRHRSVVGAGVVTGDGTRETGAVNDVSPALRASVNALTHLYRVLETARRAICCYSADPCDCKYGISKPSTPGGEVTGCCELRDFIDKATGYSPFNHGQSIDDDVAAIEACEFWRSVEAAAGGGGEGTGA